MVEFSLIGQALIISLMVMAIWATMWPDAIFDFISNYLDEKLTGKWEKWRKPIYDCPICMVPWYGSVIYWIFIHYSVMNWIIVILVAMGINTVLIKLFKEDEE